MSNEEKILNDSNEKDFEQFLKMTSEFKVPASSQGKEAAWDKLVQSIDNEAKQKTKVVAFTSRKVWYSVAASLVVLFTIATLTYRYSTVQIELSKGEVASRILPDGSEVQVNADSKIGYRKFGWLSNREIKLKGEAFFSVKHGEKFTVITDYNRKVTVTGTKFNVLARGPQFEVKCFEGSVVVETPTTKPISVTKGTGIKFSKIEEIPEQILLDSIPEPTWTKGEFYFNNTPLNLVFDELNRQFNVSVDIGSIEVENRKYTGFFKKDQVIKALDLVCIPMGFSYQISADSTRITIKK